MNITKGCVYLKREGKNKQKHPTKVVIANDVSVIHASTSKINNDTTQYKTREDTSLKRQWDLWTYNTVRLSI